MKIGELTANVADRHDDIVQSVVKGSERSAMLGMRDLQKCGSSQPQTLHIFQLEVI